MSSSTLTSEIGHVQDRRDELGSQLNPSLSEEPRFSSRVYSTLSAGSPSDAVNIHNMGVFNKILEFVKVIILVAVHHMLIIWLLTLKL